MQCTNYKTEDNGILIRLNAVRLITVVFIAIGYASTMPLGPGHSEILAQLGYDPSWIGIQILFFFSGFLAMRSLSQGRSAFEYLRSRIIRNIPLLAIFTLIAVLVIYPALGVKTESTGALISKLGRYFFETVSCIGPGRVLPGLLDEARYMCLIQGAIWTLRWGAIAHIGAAIGGQMGLFKNRGLVATFAVAAVMGYFAASFIHGKTGHPTLGTVLVGLRLAWPFLVGMACFSYREDLPTSVFGRTAILLGMGTMAVIWYHFLPWTPAIELLLTGFWIYAALLLALSETSKLSVLNNWPNLVLGLYLANWPTSQLILLASPDMSSLELIAVSVPLSLLIASGVYVLFSKRIYTFADTRGRQATVSSPPAFSQ